MGNSKLIDSLEASIKSKDLQNVTAGLAELVTDTILDEGVLRDIPIVGTLLGVSRATLTIRDKLFVRKLIEFLTPLEKVDSEKREKIISEINKSQSYKIKVGEKLLYILDKCEDHIYANYISQLFVVFLEGKIEYEDFLRGTLIIQRIFSSDLEKFISEPEKNILEERDLYFGLTQFQFTLINSGLCASYTEEITVEDQENEDDASSLYSVDGGNQEVYFTEIGKIIREQLKIININSK